MIKSLIIEFDTQDEALLLALFKKLEVKTIDVKAKAYVQSDILTDALKINNDDDDFEEENYVQNALQRKFVETGQWKNMTDEEQQDAALAEMMFYEQAHPDYKIMTAEESETFYTTLKKQLYEDTSD